MFASFLSCECSQRSKSRFPLARHDSVTLQLSTRLQGLPLPLPRTPFTVPKWMSRPARNAENVRSAVRVDCSGLVSIASNTSSIASNVCCMILLSQPFTSTQYSRPSPPGTPAPAPSSDPSRQHRSPHCNNIAPFSDLYTSPADQ